MQQNFSASRRLVAALVRPLPTAPRSRETHASVAADALVSPPATPRTPRVSHADVLLGAIAPPASRPLSDPFDCSRSYETTIPRPHTQPYAHRTFMGLAGSMLRDPRWSACLQQCMPELHAECTAPGVSITRLMRLLEGNPVLAAYGLYRGDDKTLPMEWDLWLDPHHPADLSRARVIHGNLVSTTLANSPEAHAAGVAEAIMRGERDGTDVHLGLTPLAWVAAFHTAAACGNLPMTCSAVYLDVKSSWSSAADLASFVAALQQAQVETRGVLAFDFEQLAAPLAVPHAVHLTHSPAGLAMVLPKVPQGASAMFNGGALVDTRGVEPTIDQVQFALVRKLREQRGLRIGVYLQEDEVSPQSLAVLIDCINANADLFAGGIAYGGLSGVAEGLITQGTGTGCQTQVIALENAQFMQTSDAPQPSPIHVLG